MIYIYILYIYIYIYINANQIKLTHVSISSFLIVSCFHSLGLLMQYVF